MKKENCIESKTETKINNEKQRITNKTISSSKINEVEKLAKPIFT